MEYLVATVFIVILVLILFSLYKKEEISPEELQVFTPNSDHRPCPLCSSLLSKGQRVHSTVYRDKEDQLMQIYGCPFCYTGHKQAYLAKGRFQPRYCPVCRKNLKDGVPLYARVFDKPGKTHVHVLGCPLCRKEAK